MSLSFLLLTIEHLNSCMCCNDHPSEEISSTDEARSPTAALAAGAAEPTAAEFKSSSATSMVYPVPDADASKLRSDLSRILPESKSIITDTYLKSVLSQPNSKKRSERRTIEYARRKFEAYMEWRSKSGVDEVRRGGAGERQAMFSPPRC